MKKFLVLYEAPISAMEQMASASPEQAKAGMDAWMRWARKAGDAIVDLGAPVGSGANVTGASSNDDDSKIVGYTILQEDSMEAIMELLREHPHTHVPKFSIKVFECLAVPGQTAEQPHAA